MIELSFAVSIIILSIYIKKKEIKPSREYVGDESGLVERAKEVIYYNTLNGIITLIFPIIIAFNSITGCLDGFVQHKSTWKLLVLISILCIITLIIARLFTRFAVKRAIKKNYLKKYIGGIWIDTSK